MTYTGLDKSPHMLDAARKFFPDETFIEFDATDFDLGCEYDTVISISLLLHLTEVQATKTLVCMWRHVGPGGRMIVGMETLGDGVQRRPSGLIIRNQPVLKVLDMLRIIAENERASASWSHQKLVYQTISEFVYSRDLPHKILSHQPIARTTIFMMEKPG